MGILGHLLGSALSGGLFGLIGNVTAKLFAYLDAKQQFAQRQAQWDYQTQLLKLRQPQAAAASAPKPESDAPSWLALDETLKADGAVSGSYRWVEAVRALVRPALTLGLVIVLAFAFFAMKASDPERSYVIDSLVFAGVSAITWWFGDRAPRRAIKQ